MTQAAPFRFQNLDIWKRAAAFSPKLLEIGDDLEAKKLFRFAEELRAATLNITNNIAEGSSSISNPEYADYLNSARRSVFEVANILLILSHDGRLETAQVVPLLNSLEEESRMIIGLIKNLRA